MSTRPVDGAPHQWVSFEEADGTTWLFDLTFLTSDWQCSFGSGCQGTEPDDNGARGCCAHGAHIVDDRERDLIANLAARLTPEQWENQSTVATDDDLFEVIDDALVTRRVDEACIFLNSPDFAGGHGCALHIGAVQGGDAPMTWKPTVCWQLPFRIEEYPDDAGTRTVTIRPWRRSDWGEGGAIFGWWCTDELQPAATHDASTIATHQEELQQLVGDWPLAQLNDYVAAHKPSQLSTVTPVEVQVRSARKE